MNHHPGMERRGFLLAAGFGAVGLQLVTAGSAAAQPTSFVSLKQVDAGVLNVGYAEDGPPTVLPSCCCTAGPTTSTAMSRWHRYWRRQGTG